MPTRWFLLAILTRVLRRGRLRDARDLSPLAKPRRGLRPDTASGRAHRSVDLCRRPPLLAAGRTARRPSGRTAELARGTDRRRGGARGPRVGAGLHDVPPVPVPGRHRLERRQSRARQGHHGSLPGSRARHRDGHQADGAHPGRDRLGARAPARGRLAWMAGGDRDVRLRGGPAGRAELAPARPAQRRAVRQSDERRA